MIEGTSVTVNAKNDRNSKTENARGDRLDRGSRDRDASQGKPEQYTIDTSNILFVFAGAFVGLERIINSRLSAGSSIGFGAQLKTENPKSDSNSEPSVLQQVTPPDLQTYGLIPELLGRIPIITALNPLTLPELVSILTEPRNSLVKQYTALLGTYSIQLKFTTLALRAVAERALGSSTQNKSDKTVTSGGIGARGLRSIMESVLGEIMYWGPGSGIRYCLVDEKFVRGYDKGSSQFTTKKDAEEGSISIAADGKSLMPRCWSRGQGRLFEQAFENEEEEWRIREEIRERKERGEIEPIRSFEVYREVGTSGM
jgi:ATP-dependent Clp protease ATP-binding subunit ClpX